MKSYCATFIQFAFLLNIFLEFTYIDIRTNAFTLITLNILLMNILQFNPFSVDIN